MRRLARALETDGHRVLNLGYPSRRHPLAQLAEQLHPTIAAFAAETPGRVHFVGHSMGGLLIRYYLAAHPMEKLGRIVMLGTPNRGSEVADFLCDWPAYRWLYGPVGQQLCTGVAHVPLAPVEIGIIGGDRSIDPFCSWLIGAPNDGKVALASTRPEIGHQHCVLPATHSFMPANPAVIRQVRHFIREGSFISDG